MNQKKIFGILEKVIHIIFKKNKININLIKIFIIYLKKIPWNPKRKKISYIYWKKRILKYIWIILSIIRRKITSSYPFFVII